LLSVGIDEGSMALLLLEFIQRYTPQFSGSAGLAYLTNSYTKYPPTSVLPSLNIVGVLY